MGKVRMGLVGCGFMGNTYARILAENRAIEFVGVADIDQVRVKQLSSHWKVPGYSDIHDLVKNEDLEAVIIATSDRSHREPCVAAAEKGLHILVEKPLATTYEDGRAMIDAAKKAGVTLLVGHTLRFFPHYYEAHRAIADGRLGDIIHVYARRNGSLEGSGLRLGAGTSVGFYLSIHDIDFVNWCLQSDLKTVYAQARHGLLEERGIEAEDTIFSILEYHNNTIACIESSWVVPATRGPRGSCNFEAVGTTGAIYMDPFEQGLVIQDQDDVRQVRAFEEPIMHGRKWGAYNYEVTHFLDCIEGEREPVCTGEEALRAVIAVEAIHESLRTKGKVEIAGRSGG